jgi:hypothetical protein
MIFERGGAAELCREGFAEAPVLARRSSAEAIQNLIVTKAWVLPLSPSRRRLRAMAGKSRDADHDKVAFRLQAQRDPRGTATIL